jgi:hypothetical protein
VGKAIALGSALLVALTCTAPLEAAPTEYGKISGRVVNSAGQPQMGAAVTVAAENARPSAPPLKLFTNDRGSFSAENLLPGLYTVRVSLAGFLPVIRRSVRIEPSLTTLLRLELSTLFATLDELRAKPGDQPEPDDWMWVLRTSASTRPVLRYADGQVLTAGELSREESAAQRAPRGRLELTAGARRPGSASNIADAPSSAFAYEQRIKGPSSLIFAGQASYEGSTSAGFAALWLPSGTPGVGPQTTLVMRRADLGPGRPVFRGARADHSGALPLGDRVVLRYGSEMVTVALGSATSTLRPRGQLDWRVADDWKATFSVSPRPLSTSEVPAGTLESALFALDSFPAVFLRNARPVLESGWHEEAALERRVGAKTRIVASLFRERASHTAVFGRGRILNDDFLHDEFSNTFAYDGGSSASWGARLAWQQKFGENWETTLVYAWGGMLVPEEEAPEELRDALFTRQAHSLSARVSGRVNSSGTRVVASYKWLSRTGVSRQDSFGESLYQFDPYLNVSIRQPLPRMWFVGRIEAQAEIRNLLAQGYLPVSTQDGVVMLLSTARTIRGGLSFQF